MQKKRKVMSLVLSIVGTFLLLVGCGNTGNQSDRPNGENTTGKLKIVTTFYPMYDFTKNIVQDKADVTMLIPAGTEPHDFEPSAKMIAQIENADVFIYNSEEMETWVPSALKAIDTKKVTVINASNGIEFIEHDEHDDHEETEEEGHSKEHHHAVDPHVWLDPVLAQIEVKNIQEGLATVDTENAASYQEHAAAYNEKLAALDQEFKEAFKHATNRVFVTQHAAFAYLAKQYELTQISISGLSAETEPSPAKMAELTEYVNKYHVEYIYFENNASSKIAETLANEVGIELAILDPIEGVTQKEQEAGVDYIQVMKNNLEALKKSIY
ncbi:metal ABC transporter substrate-binding protein [Carnobacterium mobile]|uniref:metal ABC transporter substrate-binding protein n=1 Tax=Carnobacterium mobile TaxID=2750 RepID=UPI001D0159D2|nr:metal ABC transporter substrate-binding protein [Carnobacterium mobile]